MTQKPKKRAGKKPTSEGSTSAKKTFDTNCRRAGYFLELHKEFQGGKRGAPVTPTRELPRAAVVFAVGALDAYLSDVSAEVLLQILEGAQATSDVRDLLAKIQKELPTLSLEVALLPSASAKRDRVHEALADHLYNKVSHHGPKGVSTAVQRIGGKPETVWSALETTWTKPADQLQKWTDNRHAIVHQGKSPQIQRPKAQECINLVSAIGAEVDRVAQVSLLLL